MFVCFLYVLFVGSFSFSVFVCIFSCFLNCDLFVFKFRFIDFHVYVFLQMRFMCFRFVVFVRFQLYFAKLHFHTHHCCTCLQPGWNGAEKLRMEEPGGGQESGVYRWKHFRMTRLSKRSIDIYIVQLLCFWKCMHMIMCFIQCCRARARTKHQHHTGRISGGR